MTAQPQAAPEPVIEDKPLVVAGRTFTSRLIIGTGKYKTYEENARALEASGAEMITVAVRRVELLRVFWDLFPRIGTVRFVNPHDLELVRWPFVSRPGKVRQTVLEALHRYGRGDLEDE